MFTLPLSAPRPSQMSPLTWGPAPPHGFQNHPRLSLSLLLLVLKVTWSLSHGSRLGPGSCTDCEHIMGTQARW